MDVLNDILDTLALKGVLYFRTDCTAPWSVTVPELGRAARFHLVVQGSCHLRSASGNTVELGPGDLALIPRGRSHQLSDAPGRPGADLETVLAESGYQGNGVLVVGEGDASATTQLICGHFDFRSGADHPLLRVLPEYLVVTASMRAREPWLDEVLRLVARKMFSDDIGSPASVTRLSEIVFIELLRLGVAQCDGLKQMIGAFRDRQVGQALQMIHERPAETWTVDSLAAEVGMSRSRFAERFSDLLGQGPMAYLAEWRLQKALALLDRSTFSVQQIAGQTGYRSPAAFTRAFSGKFGFPPTAYRRQSG
jgi:AraC family transcriptional regulator, activator of mtrCDE